MDDDMRRWKRGGPTDGPQLQSVIHMMEVGELLNVSEKGRWGAILTGLNGNGDLVS
jgi:hypothetical protein